MHKCCCKNPPFIHIKFREFHNNNARIYSEVWLHLKSIYFGSLSNVWEVRQQIKTELHFFIQYLAKSNVLQGYLQWQKM